MSEIMTTGKRAEYKPNKFDIINLLANVTGPMVVIGCLTWAKWSMDARIQLTRNEIESRAEERYVERKSYAEDLAITNARFEKINDKLSAIMDRLPRPTQSYTSPKQMNQ